MFIIRSNMEVSFPVALAPLMIELVKTNLPSSLFLADIGAEKYYWASLGLNLGCTTILLAGGFFKACLLKEVICTLPDIFISKYNPIQLGFSGRR